MLRAAVPDAVELAYAVKANPSPAILRRLAALGVGADIASAGELATVTRAGFDMRRVIFTGPGKTDAELAAAIRAGVRAITIESLEELDVLLELAPLAGRHQGLVLRLTAEEASRGAEGTPIIGAGGASKFGLLREELDEAVDRLLLAGAIGGPGLAIRAARPPRLRCLQRARRRAAARGHPVGGGPGAGRGPAPRPAVPAARRRRRPGHPVRR